jgi:hypothetical protein
MPAGLLSIEVGVLVEDLEGKRFPTHLRGHRRRHVNPDAVALVHEQIWLGGLEYVVSGFSRTVAMQYDVPVRNQLLDLRARMFCEHRYEKAIEPLTVEFRGHLEVDRGHRLRPPRVAVSRRFPA